MTLEKRHKVTGHPKLFSQNFFAFFIDRESNFWLTFCHQWFIIYIPCHKVRTQKCYIPWDYFFSGTEKMIKCILIPSLNQTPLYSLKLRHFEKAIKFEKISTCFYVTDVKRSRWFFQVLCPFQKTSTLITKRFPVHMNLPSNNQKCKKNNLAIGRVRTCAGRAH